MAALGAKLEEKLEEKLEGAKLEEMRAVVAAEETAMAMARVLAASVGLDSSGMAIRATEAVTAEERATMAACAGVRGGTGVQV